MKILHRLIRLIRINLILARYNIDEIVFGSHRFYPFRFLIYINPYYWTSGRKLTRGERVRRALEDLGPIFVKVGQILSTRRDLIPDDIAIELSKLQDCVPPFDGMLAKRIIEISLGCRIEDVFSSFDSQALASASIAQVHAARLLNGDEVVIKVLRPNIQKIIARDTDLLLTFAALADRYLSKARRLKPRQIALEISQTLYDELDLAREGANASQLRRNFANSPLLHVPRVYWEFTRENILVLERIFGIPIHDIQQLQRANVNLVTLAERGIEIFFTQVFRDRFFHADLHPGNIFVNATNPESPTYIVVDFGIVGSLNHNDQRYLAENMLAFFKRDYQRVAELHIASGWLPPDTRIDQFEGAIRAVCEPIFERPLRDISFGQLLLRLFQVARQFQINIQPQLILLQKTLLSIEGLSRQLAPEFDLWSNAAPQIERWLKKQLGVKAFLHRIRENLPLWSQQFPEVPNLIYEVLSEKKAQQERLRFEGSQQHNMMNGHLIDMKLAYFLGGVLVTLAVMMVVFYS